MRGGTRRGGELRGELADHEVGAALGDQAERRRVPEQGRAAVAEEHFVAVGEREEIGEPAADPADDRTDAFLAVAGAEEPGRGVGERGDGLVANLRRAGPESSVAWAEVGRELDVEVVHPITIPTRPRTGPGYSESSSSNPSRMHSTNTSASGTAVVSVTKPMQHMSMCEIRDTFTAAPAGGANVYMRSTRAPPVYTGTGAPGTFVATKSQHFSIPPKSAVVVVVGSRFSTPANGPVSWRNGLGPLLLHERADGAHALARVGDGDRDREPRRREAVAGRVVALAAEIDRERHAQLVGTVAVAFVVAVQPAHDRGDEHVVDGAFGCLARALDVVEGEIEEVEAAAEPAIAHDRRHRNRRRRERTADRRRGACEAEPAADRIADDGRRGIARSAGHAARHAHHPA